MAVSHHIRDSEFTLTVDGIAIRGETFFPVADKPLPTVIICHGIPAEVKAPNDRGYADFAEAVAADALGVVIFNFRGCGLSGGNFEIGGWQRDLKAVIAHTLTLPQVDAKHLAVLGFSGGAAVAAIVAADAPALSAVALAACPADLDGIALAPDMDAMLDYFRGVQIIRDAGFPPDPAAWQREFTAARAEDFVARIAPRPLLVAHGDADETVPSEHAQRLYRAAAAPKTLEIFPGLGHRLRHDAAAMRVVVSWLKQALR